MPDNLENVPEVAPLTRVQVKMLLNTVVEYVKRRIGKRPFINGMLSMLWAEVADGVVDDAIAYMKANGYSRLFA